VRDLVTFRRFLGLIASRHGQVLNRTDVAGPLGVSVPTVSQWLHVLEVTGQILLIPPYFENFGKRLIKSPKIYISDSGLACHLLGIRTKAELERSPFLGAIVEGLVASELVKSQTNVGTRREVYFFRDRAGLEVDFVVPHRDGLRLIEVKAGRTIRPEDARPLLAVRPRSMSPHADRWIVHRPTRSRSATRVVSPGVEAFTIDEMVTELYDHGRNA
jgi:predicted AAA+ superfamily ATPase